MARLAIRSWPQRLHERDECIDFRGAQILAVGRHVAAALQHLTNELIAGLARRDAVQRWPALSPLTAQAVAGPALLVLHPVRAPALGRRGGLERSCPPVGRRAPVSPPGTR